MLTVQLRSCICDEIPICIKRVQSCHFRTRKTVVAIRSEVKYFVHCTTKNLSSIVLAVTHSQ